MKGCDKNHNLFSYIQIFIRKCIDMDRRIRQIVLEELSKSDVESMISRKLGSSYDSKEFKKAVKQVSAEVIEDLYRTLWNRSSMWRGGVVK
jgi:hypothetical protein